MHYSQDLDEETLKLRVKDDFFSEFSLSTLAKVDFALFLDKLNKDDTKTQYLLWAEAKTGKSDIYKSFTQLLLTIGVHKLHKNYNAPHFLAAFDSEKIAFVPFGLFLSFLSRGDFNWKAITPSDYTSETFEKMQGLIIDILKNKIIEFNFAKDAQTLKKFIKNSVLTGKNNPIKIDIENLDLVYSRWKNAVFPLINLGKNWEKIRISNKDLLIESDFFLADLLSKDNQGLLENLRIILNKKIRDNKEELSYEVKKLKDRLDYGGDFYYDKISITDINKYHQFWNLYERPPEQKFWHEIHSRRDKLTPRDIMERKGAFFTPKIWSDKAKVYLAEALGKDWQENYYIWDCAAGTGNLLTNLNHPERIFASTLDLSDVLVMKELAQNDRSNDKKNHKDKLNLLENHIFQFDFLNDSFEKLPQNLQNIINDKDKRQKLVIFINPPYAEAGNIRQTTGTGKNKDKVAIDNAIYRVLTGKGNEKGIKIESRDYLGKASNELFAQFFMRIAQEIDGCWLAEFSKLKILQATNFSKFRQNFKAALKGGFMVPADTFDNVKGQFPIGFMIWKLEFKK